MRINSLPADIFALIFDALEAPDVGGAARVSRQWRLAATRAAENRLQQRTTLFANLGQPHWPCWLSALGMVWLLDEMVGPSPKDRTWQDEFEKAYPGMLMRVTCKFPWSMELREAGWPKEHADVLPMVYTWPNSKATFPQAKGFAACIWAVREALVAAASRQALNAVGPTPPLLYANLHGRGGLQTMDANWEALERPFLYLGTSRTFRTLSIALAGDGPAGIYWSGLPSTAASCSGVVCFRQGPADSSGLHALVDVGSGRFAVPPLTTVRLLRIDAPGSWRLPWMGSEAEPMACPLYTVAVTWV